jgi:predicted amidophosphoribosyltransferase
MKVCNNCEKECSDDMNFCEVCGEELAYISTVEDAEPTVEPKEEQLDEKQVMITKEDGELDSFLDEMCSMENREVLKDLISGTGAEWFGKDKEFMREVMVKFAEFKAKKNDTTDFYNNI